MHIFFTKCLKGVRKMALSSKGGKNAYKKRGLSRKNRFSNKKTNMGAIVVIVCVLATFIFAIILGNILGDKANSVTTSPTPSGPSSDTTLPSVEKVPPKDELNAYLVNFAGIDPDVESLYPFTSEAREKGNALFFEIADKNGKIVYKSEATEELNLASHSLALSKIEGHFAYYAYYAIGYYKTDFSSSFSAEKRAKIQYNDILILQETTKKACDEIVISFAGEINKNDLIYYQTYLLNIKLALPEIPIGIEFSRNVLVDSDASGTIASLMEYADYFMVDLSNFETQEMKEFLGETAYYFAKYKGIVLVSSGEETFEESMIVLDDKKIYNYIVK